MNIKTLEEIQKTLDQAQLAGHIYQQDQLLVLQEPFTQQGEALNIFVQHDLTADQLGMQFGIKVLDDQIEFLIGITRSNQDRRSEIGTWNLKGEQKAFNLCYAFYNYPKHFYLLRCPLQASTTELENILQSELFDLPELDFLNTAIKVNAMGQEYFWIKNYILELASEMKMRIQNAVL